MSWDYQTVSYEGILFFAMLGEKAEQAKMRNRPMFPNLVFVANGNCSLLERIACVWRRSPS
jgi:hypothetical protein